MVLAALRGLSAIRVRAAWRGGIAGCVGELAGGLADDLPAEKDQENDEPVRLWQPGSTHGAAAERRPGRDRRTVQQYCGRLPDHLSIDDFAGYEW